MALSGSEEAFGGADVDDALAADTGVSPARVA